MSHDLNGASQRIANNALVLLAARMMAVIGVPIALGFAVWLSTATLGTKEAVIEIRGDMKAIVQATESISKQVDGQAGRINRLEERFMRQP